MSMNVLLLGSGGREHAIAWRLSQSPLLGKLWVAPGNAGTGDLGENVAIRVSDPDEVLALAERVRADLVIVGPEDPLAAGVARIDPAGAVVTPAGGGGLLDVLSGVSSNRIEIMSDSLKIGRAHVWNSSH